MCGLVVHVGQGVERARAAVALETGSAEVTVAGQRLVGSWSQGVLQVEGLAEPVRVELEGELAQGLREMMGYFYSHAA